MPKVVYAEVLSLVMIGIGRHHKAITTTVTTTVVAPICLYLKVGTL